MADKSHRQYFAKTGFWGRRAAGCLFFARSSARLCFALRSKHALQPMTYGTWGGAIDGSESPLQAVLRETREEAGIEVAAEQAQPLFVFRHQDIFEYHNFVVEVDDEFEPELNWENAGFVWSEFGAWPDPLHPGVIELMAHAPSFQTLRVLARVEGEN